MKLGDYCKWLEKNFSNEIMIPTLPVIIRLDGNNFSSWTKGLEKPFDERLIKLMIDTTKFLVEETNAVVGYTQSDEITLILYSPIRSSQIYHDGKKQKIVSKLTAKCVNYFNERRKELLPNHNKTAVFDCRIYQTPSIKDAVAQLIWRKNDAVRNSILSLSQKYYSHKEMMNIKTNELIHKLKKDFNVDWNDLPDYKKRGSYIKKYVKESNFTEEEISKLPPQHDYFKKGVVIKQRNVISEINIPFSCETDEMLKLLFDV